MKYNRERKSKSLEKLMKTMRMLNASNEELDNLDSYQACVMSTLNDITLRKIYKLLNIGSLYRKYLYGAESRTPNDAILSLEHSETRLISEDETINNSILSWLNSSLEIQIVESETPGDRYNIFDFHRGIHNIRIKGGFEGAETFRIFSIEDSDTYFSEKTPSKKAFTQAQLTLLLFKECKWFVGLYGSVGSGDSKIIPTPQLFKSDLYTFIPYAKPIHLITSISHEMRIVEDDIAILKNVAPPLHNSYMKNLIINTTLKPYIVKSECEALWRYTIVDSKELYYGSEISEISFEIDFSEKRLTFKIEYTNGMVLPITVETLGSSKIRRVDETEFNIV